MTFEEYLKTSGKSYNTIKNYLVDIDKMNNPGEATEEDYRNKINQLKNEGYSNSSINRFITSNRMYWEFLINIKEVDRRNPLSKIGFFNIKSSTPYFLNLSEVKKFCKYPDSKLKNKRRDRCMFHLLRDTGMRVSELLNLRRKDLNLFKSRIKVNRSKNDTEGWLPFKQDTKTLLYRYNKNNDFKLNDKLFPVSKSYLYFLCQRTGKKVLGHKVSPHDLRHTRGFSWIAKGGDIRVLQVMLGHKDINTTMKYAQVTPDVLQKVFKKIENDK